MKTSNLNLYGKFLFSHWQVIADSEGDELTAYQWILAHRAYWQPDQLLLALPQAATRFLHGSSTPSRIDRVRAIAVFGNLVQQYPLGARSLQIELAIVAYQQALLGLSFPTVAPGVWANTLNNLATAYRSRLVGDRAENLELAIQTYQQALQGQTPQSMPHLWPVTTTALARAYAERAQGDRADNLNRATRAYRQALQIVSPETFPKAWKMISHHLAIIQFEQEKLAQLSTCGG